jgi:ATP-dependent Zn protease
MINEAALRAVRMKTATRVTQQDLEESVETVIAGAQRKEKPLSSSENEKKMVAYHEVGHALVAAKQADSAPVHKITISAAHRRRAGLHHAGRSEDDAPHGHTRLRRKARSGHADRRARGRGAGHG